MWTTARQDGLGRLLRLLLGQRRRLGGAGGARLLDPRLFAFGAGRVEPRHPGDGDDEDDAGGDDHAAHRGRERFPFPADRAAASEEAADRPVADRLLDEAPGERGDREDRRHLDQFPQQALVLRVLRVGRGEDDHRRLPEVDRVGADADPAQRPHPEEDAEPAGRVRQRHQHQHRRQREDDEAALVEERVELADLPDHDRDHQQAEDAEAVEHVARLRGDPAAEAAARPDHRQRRAEQQAAGAGVGAVVDPRGVEGRVVEDRHLDRRDQRQRDRQQRQPRPDPRGQRPLVHELDPEQQQEGPEDVELLLDRERPEVVERFFRREAGEVGDVAEDLLPVVDVEDRRDDRLAELVGLGGAEDRHPGDDDRQHHEQRRQQAPGAGQPELAELDPAAGRELGEQQVGDQVAGEGEEDPDPQQSSRRPAETEVEDDHRQHRDRAQPVEPGHVALVALYWFGHGRTAC